MINNADRLARSQRGSVLLAALFLIVVLAALGAFAVNLGADQQQTATLQLQQYRAAAAANSGLEFLANRLSANPALACPALPTPIATLNGVLGMNGFNVTLTCVRIVSGPAAVYEVTSTASSSAAAFGSPDFVQRSATRRMTNIAPRNWQR